MKRLSRLQQLGQQVRVYPDAEEFIQQRSTQERLRGLTAAMRRDPANHPLRTGLLKATLLPYQLDGIAFAAGAGRAVLADDMGLGKTIQGVGVAELLAREADAARVLIVCPTSLKSQWRSEIDRFTDRETQIVAGRTAERDQQYGRDCFFTICNYEQVLRDILPPIERVAWDLIVLDEGQRIKNWEAKTSRVIKSLRSRSSRLVLSGTPLENRLDDLYSVVAVRRTIAGSAPASGSSISIAWLMKRGACSATRISLACVKRSSRCCSAARGRASSSTCLRAPSSSSVFSAERRATRAARRAHASRGDNRPQEVHFGNGSAAAAKRTAHVPHDGRIARVHLSINKHAGALDEAGATRGTDRATVRRRRDVKKSCCSRNGRRCWT